VHGSEKGRNSIGLSTEGGLQRTNHKNLEVKKLKKTEKPAGGIISHEGQGKKLRAS